MIEIHGLTSQQKLLADIIWMCDTQQNVDRFIDSLPTDDLKYQAQSVIELMVLACQEKQDIDCNQAQSILNNIFRK